VVTTAAYRHFVAANSLQPEIECLAHAAPPDNMTALASAAEAIAALFARATMPAPIAQAIREAYLQMRELPVAVRSSATAEDLPGASFAGQMETYLNVRGETALLAAVRRCWASLWTARAISYRANQGIEPGAVSLAVVVQELLAADAAGVLFTANPINGRRDQMVIDGAWGLGEALVGGQVTPDHWVVSAPTAAVLSARIARKEAMTVRQEAGTALVDVPVGLQERPVLDEAQVAALTMLGRRVAAHYGAPQDIEWALAGGQLYLVQARPITSLFPLPQPEPPASAGPHVYVSFNLVIEGVVEPFTPIGLAGFRAIFHAFAGVFGARSARGAAPPGFKVAASRIYLDITPLVQNRTTRALLRSGPSSLMDSQAPNILRFLLERDRSFLRRSRSLPFRPPLGLMVRMLGQMIRNALFPDAARARLLARTEARVRALEQQAEALDELRTGALAQRAQFAEEALAAVFAETIQPFYPPILVAVVAAELARRCLQAWLGDAAALQPVLRALPHNPTTEMGLALWAVSRRLAQEGAPPSADHPAVQAFLARYGHRGALEIDLGVPRWREDPAPVLNILRTYLTHGPEADAEQQFHRGMELADETVANLIERVRREKGRLRAAWLRFLLQRVRALTGLREVPKFYIVRILAAVRRVLAGAGAELVAAGRLDRAEDVFFLDMQDWQTAHDLRAVASANRADYERERSRRAVPRVMTSTGEAFYTAPTTTPGALVGTPVSAGTYEGPVRVVFDPGEAELGPGEVLVAPATDPAWTPLFLTAGALVMEVGGTMSHGSVVAREYGIPAVVGVAGATQQLRTGQRVRVDGENGLVVPL
jgi:pyruvate,water dikinase